jgi:hypothetical protein
MNVEIGAEAALFPEKEYISGILVAVWNDKTNLMPQSIFCSNVNRRGSFLHKRAYFVDNRCFVYTCCHEECEGPRTKKT